MLRLAFALEIDPGVFAMHARDNGWEPVEVDPDDDDDRPTWKWRVPGGELVFVDDTVVEVQYVDISADPVEPIRAAIAVELTAYDRDTCVELLDLAQPEDTVTNCLRLLAVTAPGAFHQGALDGALAALRDGREAVRYWALKIANYTQWPQFLPEVRRIEAEDPNDRVRSFAGNSRVILEASARASGG